MHKFIPMLQAMKFLDEKSIKSTKDESCYEGDIVKDDSGSYAVFTEQGSSASQMTGAKVMDVIARPGGTETSSGRNISLHPGQNGGRSQNADDSEVRVPRYMGASSSTQVSEIMVKHGRLWFFSNEICTETHLQASCGKDSSKKFHWDLDGEEYRIGNVCLFIGNSDYSCRYTWLTSNWLEESRIWLSCGRN